jgi:hypothetical protein
MLGYLLLLANPAQLIPANPGNGAQTSRLVIVLGTDHEHDDGRGRIHSFSRGPIKHVPTKVTRKADIIARRYIFRFDPAAESCD